VTIGKKIGELFSEIQRFSQEQVPRLQQITHAVNIMTGVVLDAAAKTEESASAAEELSAQAESMKGFVDQLAHVLGSDRNSLRQADAIEYGTRDAMQKTLVGPSSIPPAGDGVSLKGRDIANPEGIMALEKGNPGDF
jgi:methyl-accepting chemotaxis protein